MKKLILSVAAIGTLCVNNITAQTAARPAEQTGTQKAMLTPEQEVENHIKKMDQVLGLTDDQKAKIKVAGLERINTVRPLREQEKTATDKKSIHDQIKAANEKLDTELKSILTQEQQAKWAEHKKAMEEKHKDQKNTAAPAPSGTAK